jgi:hypothetical protein
LLRSRQKPPTFKEDACLNPPFEKLDKLQKVYKISINIDSDTRGVAALPDSPTERLSPCSTIASAHASVMVNRANYMTARAPTPCLINDRSHHGR